MGVRTNVPFNQLTEQQERDIVFAATIRSTSYTSRKKATISPNSTSRTTTPYTPWRTPSPKPRTKKGLNVLRGSSKSVPAAIAEGPDFPNAPASHVSETSIWLRQPRCLLDALVSWGQGSVPESLEPHMRTMASAICESFLNTSRRLLELGLGYLSFVWPRRSHAVHRRAPTRAACPRRAQSHHRRVICAG